MIVAVLKEGLGNQLFQYAAAKHLAYKLGTSLKLDTSSFKTNRLRDYSLNHFNISADFISSRERLVFRIKNLVYRTLKSCRFTTRVIWYHERFTHFDENVGELEDNICLDGYWQSEKYFKDIESIIRQELVVKTVPDRLNQEVLDLISNSISVSIHVRRGDYVQDEIVNQTHGVCDLEYYNRAIEEMVRKLGTPHFFLFSDDNEWVKKNLKIAGHPLTYVDFNRNRDYNDLRLMYSCKHNITANSSFSWWGAWLNQNKDKIVISPRKWFRDKNRNDRDIIPVNWLQL